MKKTFILTLIASLSIFCSCNKDPKQEQQDPQKPTAEYTRMFEDFENEGMLTWTGSNGASFEIADNPSKNGINTSNKCGMVTASGAQWEFTWSTAFGGDESPNYVKFSEEGFIVKVDVYSPKANSPVYLKFEGTDVQAIEITTVKTTKANEWETLEFDYEPFSMVDGAYKNFVILFDAGVTTNGGEVFYFDNVRLCQE